MRLRFLLCALCAAFSLNASAAIPASEQAVAVEFYHATFDHYFISADPKEINDLDTGVHKGWTRTGYRFAVMKGGSSYAGTSPVCRFYSPSLDTHFYSAKKSECDEVKEKFSNIWTFESDEVFRAFVVDPETGVCAADTTPTYRLYNNRPDANHRYSDQISVFLYMKAKNYIPEGDGSPDLPIVFCTPAGGDVVPQANENAPNCTVTAPTPTPALGTKLKLDATCTNSPTTYMWIGCTSTTSSCESTKTTAGAVAYTLYAANGSGTGDPVTLTITWGGGGGGGGGGNVSICELTASSTQPTVASAVTLTASCNNTPASYEWMTCSADFGTPTIPTSPPACNAIPTCLTQSPTCAVSQAQAGPARYAVDAKNAAGVGPKAYIDLAWAGAGGGGGGSVPVCSLSTTNNKPSVGSTITLTATCTGSPTSYDWIGEGIIGTCTGSTCQASSSIAQGVTYGVSGINGAGQVGGRAYVGVTWTQTTPQPPACTLSASNTTPQVGQTITISSSCTNSPLSWTWKAGCTSTASACTDSASAAGPKVYTMSATNAAGNSPDASVTVNWQAPQPPACTLSASNTTPQIGQTITISSSCTNGPLNWTWKAGCTSTTSTCTDSASTEGPKVYTMSATNAAGNSPDASVTVNWQPQPTQPPACTLSSSNPSPFTGQSITLTATCTNAPTSYSWSGCTSSTSTCTTTSTSAGLVTYGVTATNQINTSPPATANVTWQTTPGSNCSQYPDVKYINIPWGSTARYKTQDVGGFPQNRIIVVSITVPESPASYPIVGNTAFAEWQAPPAKRYMTLSETACDFVAPIGSGSGNSPFIGWNVGVPPASLQPGHTYYFNLRNQPGACTGSSCDMSTTIGWPH